MEKLFLVEIDSLDNAEGCYASNKYFAEFFEVSKGRCSQIINSLKDKGFIEISYTREGKEIKRRTIKSLLINGKVFSKLTTPYLENDKGVFRKCTYPYLENDKENNTFNNNTFNNTKNIYSAFEKAWKEYPLKKGKNAVNKKNKEAIEKLGEEKILQAVRNYIKDIAHQRANGFKDLNYMNGSTFFNGRYEDYLEESSITPLKPGSYVQDTNDWDGFDLGMRV